MSTAFVNVPLFQGIDDEGLKGLWEVFERYEAQTDEVLFATGDKAEYVWLLVEGSVAVREDGKTHIELQPVSVLGELGAMSSLLRRVTAVALEDSVFLRATGDALMRFFSRNSQVAVVFYQNLLGMAGDKVRRDERRIDDMRANIIATQKTLKQLRNLILESPDTVVSQPVHDMLQALIAQNRRANYSVEPPVVMPAQVRLPDGQTFVVTNLSRRVMVVPAAAAAPGDTDWRGVLDLSGVEIPIAGSVFFAREGVSRIELDHVIEEYADTLEDYLTQAQLLDIVL